MPDTRRDRSVLRDLRAIVSEAFEAGPVRAIVALYDSGQRLSDGIVEQ